MGRVVTVTSGKGGVGKSTTSASLSMGLAMRGYKTLVIDFDIGLRNLDLLLGHEKRVLFDIVNVMNGEVPLDQAVIRDHRCESLYQLPGSQTENKDVLDLKSIAQMIDQARHNFDYIICDSPAGIEHGARMAMYFADDAVLVATPELPSIRDTDRVIGLIMEKSFRAMHGLNPVRTHLLINRYNPDTVDDAVTPESIVQQLNIPLLGVIPEDQGRVSRAANRGEPVILDSTSAAGRAYIDTVSRYLDEDIPIRFGRNRKRGWRDFFRAGRRAGAG